MKNKIVIFTTNNARIVISDDVKKYKTMTNALINPDLSKVAGVPTHHWKLSGGKVAEMSRPEKVARDLQIQLNGIDNSLIELPINKYSYKLAKYLPIIYAFLAGATISWVICG